LSYVESAGGRRAWQAVAERASPDAKDGAGITSGKALARKQAAVKIEHVYVISHRYDLRYTRSCVASIRCWYPELPISLVKDEARGSYSTRELEHAWDVGVVDTERRRFGSGWGKLAPLIDGPKGQRCLILDSDVVFVGPVLDGLEESDADFVVEAYGGNPALLSRDYFDLHALAAFDPEFVFPGYTFNTGQIVATCGLLQRSELEPFIDFDELIVEKRRDIFNWASDQGVLNYLLLKKTQLGEITLERRPFMLWAAGLPRRMIRARELTTDSPHPYVVHWAGPKRKILLLTTNSRLLRHFEAEYYTRIPRGRGLRFLRTTSLAWSILRRKEPLRVRRPLWSREPDGSVGWRTRPSGRALFHPRRGRVP
jgi:hypothetical protein